MTSIRDWCPGCNETGWACKCRKTKQVMAEIETRPFDIAYLEQAEAHVEEGPIGEPAARSILAIALNYARQAKAQENVIEALEGALKRLDHNFVLALRGKPVRDMDETRAEVRAALALVSPPSNNRGSDQ